MNFEVAVREVEVALGMLTKLRYVKSVIGSSCILVLPAHGVPAKSYDGLIKALARKVGSAAVADLRGQGASSVKATRKNNYGYHELLKQDIPALIAATQEVFDLPVYLLGHSLGGQLSCLYSATDDPRVKGLILCASGSVYFKCWQGTERFKVLLGSQFFRVYAKLKGYFPGRLFKFGGRTFQRLINDWGRQALSGRYVIEGSDRQWELMMSQTQISILAISLKKDFLAPPEAVNHLCDKMKKASLTKHCLDKPDLDHFNWLKSPDEFIVRIASWLHA